jgi:hypothetical protein
LPSGVLVLSAYATKIGRSLLLAWVLTEIDPDNPDIAFGLCDLGLGYSELGSVSLSELESLRGKLHLPVERDLYFTATKTLSAYADEARAHGAITA